MRQLQWVSVLSLLVAAARAELDLPGLTALQIQNSKRDAKSLGGGAWSGSVLEQGDALKIHFAKHAKKKSPPRRFYESWWSAWSHHWGQVAEHSAYVYAVAGRSGLYVFNSAWAQRAHVWEARTAVAALLAEFRIVAFTSEVGESLRPLIARTYVVAAYAISWLYVSLDVLLRSADEFALRGPTLRILRTFLFFTVFHTIATMLLPAVLIHEAVHHSEVLLRHLARRAAANGREITARVLNTKAWWVPSVIGLSLIPLMPLFDEPIEKLLEMGFKQVWRLPKSKKRRLTDYEVATKGDDPTYTPVEEQLRHQGEEEQAEALSAPEGSSSSSSGGESSSGGVDQQFVELPTHAEQESAPPPAPGVA